MNAVAEAPTQGKTAYPTYRTMTPTKKTLALLGDKAAQLEWMREEIHEFHEAIHLGNRPEIVSECFGLLRTAAQFPETIDMLNKELFYIQSVMFMTHVPSEYARYEREKHEQGQALGMTLASLLDVFERLEATANGQAEAYLNQHG